MSFTNVKDSDKKKTENFRRKVYMFLVSTLQLQILQFYFNFCHFCMYLFPFFTIFSKFCFKQISILCTLGFLIRSSINARKPHSKNPELTSLHYFEIGIPKNFNFSQYSQNLFLPLMPRFLRSPHKLHGWKW